MKGAADTYQGRGLIADPIHQYIVYTRPGVVEVAEAIPFTALTEMSVEKLYALKGQIVSRGVKAITGFDMPVFPKRRFQHGAVPEEKLRLRLPQQEVAYRRQFSAIYA